MKMIIFIIGLILGELFGASLMCIVQINKKDEQ